MGSVAILAAALVWMTLQVPSYAQAKAFYAQPALPALVILFAVGAAWLLGRGRWARRGFWVLLIVWSLVALHGVTGSQSEATLITAGRAFLQAGDPQRAEGCFDRALELKAKSPEVQAEAQVGRFWALLGQERRGEAEAALAAALELDPRHPEALLAQARRRASAGRWREAGELARSSLAETSKTGAPGELRAQLLLAEALVQQGRSAEAMTELQRALAGTPESRPVHRALVELALRRGEAATAARHLEMLRRLRPGDQELGALEERLRGLSSGQELP